MHRSQSLNSFKLYYQRTLDEYIQSQVSTNRHSFISYINWYL